MSPHWALRFIHFLYTAFMTVAACVKRHKHGDPKSLKARRSKIPKHLCLNLVVNDDMPMEETEIALLQCLQSVAAWCRALGIEKLTAYDRQGVLYERSEDARRRVFVTNETLEDSCESEVEYPLTPPLSESSGSRSHSPEYAMFPADLNVISMMYSSRLRKRRNVAVRRQSKSASRASSNLTLYLTSRASGKPAIVSVGRSLFQDGVSGASMSNDTTLSIFRYNLTVSKLDTVLGDGLPPPDFMIIHHIGNMKVPYPPMELHGFPPWQITLTEFHRTHPDGSELLGTHESISEIAFCRALDAYAETEFRLGR